MIFHDRGNPVYSQKMSVPEKMLFSFHSEKVFYREKFFLLVRNFIPFSQKKLFFIFVRVFFSI